MPARLVRLWHNSLAPKDDFGVFVFMKHKYNSYWYFLLPVLALGLGLLAWQALITIKNLPAFILPPPAMVFQRFLLSLKDGTLLWNSLVTLEEVLSGLAIGILTAGTLGYLLAKFPNLERLLSPYIVASQSVPIVAIAPLLIIWFPQGILSKVLICALIVFFPILINTVVGMRSVPDDLRDLMRVLHASRLQTFLHLEVPVALPVLLGGLRIGATLAVIGAVVGEFVGSDEGLGFLINQARGVFDTALVFVAVFTLIFMALALYGIVVLLERWLLGWKRQPTGMMNAVPEQPAERNI